MNAWGGPGEGYTWPSSNHGISIDPMDNIWIGGNGADSHVLKFSRDGEFLASYGEVGAQMPASNSETSFGRVAKISFDAAANEAYLADGYVNKRVAVLDINTGELKRFWGAYGNVPDDARMGPYDPDARRSEPPCTHSHVLKFSRDGEFLARPSGAWLADGYVNKRVAVLDINTGELKRFWGAYGNVPDDARMGPYDPDAPLPQQFRNPVHCADPSNDDFVYVCDRQANRIQVFRKDGTFVDEVRIAPRTFGDGSTWDIAFSRDPEQKYMYVADGKNMKVYVMDRMSLEVLTSFGDGGRQPGLFFAVHSIATDSQGNIYTTETYEGKRVQKFVYKGMGPVTAENQGAPWPRGN